MRELGKMLTAMTFALSAVWSGPCLAWGDEGHEVIGLIARSFLGPAARERVDALLAADTDTLAAHDIAAARDRVNMSIASTAVVGAGATSVRAPAGAFRTTRALKIALMGVGAEARSPPARHRQRRADEDRRDRK